VKGEEDRHAGGADTGEQVAQLLPQPDDFGDLPGTRGQILPVSLRKSLYGSTST
jgi:hypothetical protein